MAKATNETTTGPTDEELLELHSDMTAMANLLNSASLDGRVLQARIIQL